MNKTKVDHLDPWAFLRSFTYKDVLTSLAIALSYLSIFELVDYFNDWGPDPTLIVIKIVTFFILLILNHAVYKLEHGQVNNFIGRIMNSCFLVIIYFVLRNLDAYLTGFDMPNGDSNLVGFILSVIFVILLSEFLLTLFKSLLKLIRCDIF